MKVLTIGLAAALVALSACGEKRSDAPATNDTTAEAPAADAMASNDAMATGDAMAANDTMAANDAMASNDAMAGNEAASDQNGATSPGK